MNSMVTPNSFSYQGKYNFHLPLIRNLFIGNLCIHRATLQGLDGFYAHGIVNRHVHNRAYFSGEIFIGK